MRPVGWDALGQWGEPAVARIEPLAGGVANDVWSVHVHGRLTVGRLGARSDADLTWETGLLQHLDREGMTVPVPIPTTAGRLFADGLVVMTYVEGGPPETEADWRRVASANRRWTAAFLRRTSSLGRTARARLQRGMLLDLRAAGRVGRSLAERHGSGSRRDAGCSASRCRSLIRPVRIHRRRAFCRFRRFRHAPPAASVDAGLAAAPGLAIVDRPPARRDRDEDRPRRDAARGRCSMPGSVGAACRTSDLRRPRRPQPVQHPHDRRSGRADRLGRAHVDVPDLDLVLPHNAAGLDDEAHDIAAQAWAAWEAAVCWDDEHSIKRLAEVRAV